MDMRVLFSYAAVCIYFRVFVERPGKSTKESLPAVFIAVFGLELIRVHIDRAVLREIGIQFFKSLVSKLVFFEPVCNVRFLACTGQDKRRRLRHIFHVVSRGAFAGTE
jgi:hypothetical protein